MIVLAVIEFAAWPKFIHSNSTYVVYRHDSMDVLVKDLCVLRSPNEKKILYTLSFRLCKSGLYTRFLSRQGRDACNVDM